jgi:hypothetical protein
MVLLVSISLNCVRLVSEIEILTKLSISRCSASGSHLKSRLVAELKKPPSPRLEPRTFFRGCGLFPVVSVPKQIALVLSLLFFSSYVPI